MTNTIVAMATTCSRRLKTNAFRWVTLTAALLAAGCADPAGENEPSAAEADLTASSPACVGLLLDLPPGDDKRVEDAGLATFDDQFVLPPERHRARVEIPNALAIIHEGDYMSGKLALYGKPVLQSREDIIAVSVGGATAKAIFDAMTKVPTTSQTFGGVTTSTRASADGTISCSTNVEDGTKRGWDSCTIKAHKTDRELQVATLDDCKVRPPEP